MMWAPFVEQTIAMVRDHRHKYRRGPGYHKSDGCNIERCACSIAPALWDVAEGVAWSSVS